jgi:hypothetical protein
MPARLQKPASMRQCDELTNQNWLSFGSTRLSPKRYSGILLIGSNKCTTYVYVQVHADARVMRGCDARVWYCHWQAKRNSDNQDKATKAHTDFIVASLLKQRKRPCFVQLFRQFCSSHSRVGCTFPIASFHKRSNRYPSHRV